LVITDLGLMGIELCLKVVTLFCGFEDGAIGVTYELTESEDCIGTIIELRLAEITFAFGEFEDDIGTIIEFEDDIGTIIELRLVEIILAFGGFEDDIGTIMELRFAEVIFVF